VEAGPREKENEDIAKYFTGEGEGSLVYYRPKPEVLREQRKERKKHPEQVAGPAEQHTLATIAEPPDGKPKFNRCALFLRYVFSVVTLFWLQHMTV
jgi:hypothetical protein